MSWRVEQTFPLVIQWRRNKKKKKQAIPVPFKELK